MQVILSWKDISIFLDFYNLKNKMQFQCIQKVIRETIVPTWTNHPQKPKMSFEIVGIFHTSLWNAFNKKHLYFLGLLLVL
jgi:hypothetical protein